MIKIFNTTPYSSYSKDILKNNVYFEKTNYYNGVTDEHKLTNIKLSSYNPNTNYEELFNLTPKTITKMKVYFWVEGQDVDCENNASGGDITLKLQFSLNQGEEAAP